MPFIDEFGIAPIFFHNFLQNPDSNFVFKEFIF